MIFLIVEASHTWLAGSTTGDHIGTSVNSIQLTLSSLDTTHAVYVVTDPNYQQTECQLRQLYQQLPWVFSDGEVLLLVSIAPVITRYLHLFLFLPIKFVAVLVGQVD